MHSRKVNVLHVVQKHIVYERNKKRNRMRTTFETIHAMTNYFCIGNSTVQGCLLP